MFLQELSSTARSLIAPPKWRSDHNLSHYDQKLVRLGRSGVWLLLVAAIGIASFLLFAMPALSLSERISLTLWTLSGPLIGLWLGYRGWSYSLLSAFIVMCVTSEIAWILVLRYSVDAGVSNMAYAFLPTLGLRFLLFFSILIAHPRAFVYVACLDALVILLSPFLIDPNAINNFHMFTIYALILGSQLLLGLLLSDLFNELNDELQNVNSQTEKLVRIQSILDISVQDSFAALICFDGKGEHLLARGLWASYFITDHNDRESELVDHLQALKFVDETKSHDDQMHLRIDDRIFVVYAHKRDNLSVYAIFDITEQHQNERIAQEAQKQILTSELTSGIVHDYNNLLAIVVNNLDALDREDRREIRKRYLSNAMAALGQAKNTSRRLLKYMGKRELELEPINVAHVLEELVPIFRSAVPDHITITVNCRDRGYVISNRNELETALLNLILNARNALGSTRGEIKISVNRGKAFDELEICICDDGPGIPEEYQERIFDPFFSTKKTLYSSGLGLSMVQSFMNYSHGKIQLESRPGKTSFRLSFKRAAPARFSANSDALKAMPEACTKNALEHFDDGILFIDDNEVVLNSLKPLVRRLHPQSFFAASGKEGLKMLEDEREISVCVLDYSMPDLNGIELGEVIKAKYPHMRLILLTGDANANRSDEAENAGFEKVLFKPLRIDELMSEILTTTTKAPAVEASA